MSSTNFGPFTRHEVDGTIYYELSSIFWIETNKYELIESREVDGKIIKTISEENLMKILHNQKWQLMSHILLLAIEQSHAIQKMQEEIYRLDADNKILIIMSDDEIAEHRSDEAKLHAEIAELKACKRKLLDDICHQSLHCLTVIKKLYTEIYQLKHSMSE